MIERDVPITMDDGLVLRADVFRPAGPGRHPVLLTYGPYAKGLAFQEGYADQWRLHGRRAPRRRARVGQPVTRTGRPSTRRSGCPTATPACGWTRAARAAPPACSTRSPRARPATSTSASNGPRAQPWSSGKVGLNGISYYAMNAWHVAGLQPPHLAAICVWEGAADFYRDATHHGGILSTFFRHWYDKQVTVVQHGLATRPAQRGHRGAGGRPGNPHRGRTGGRAGAVRRADRRPPAGRRVLPRPVRATGTGSPCRC